MQIVILGTQAQKDELLQSGARSTAELIWITDLHEIAKYRSADAIMDLLFENDIERIKLFSEFKNVPVIINSVCDTLEETNPSFIRIAGWTTFLTGAIIEGSCIDDSKKTRAEEVMAQLGKELQWLPDTPGFVTPRVVSMIINEAYLALEEGVSTPEEINTAMKLGTAYPYGPIDWGNRIGLQNVATLLNKLAVAHHRYTPAPLLLQETDRSI